MSVPLRLLYGLNADGRPKRISMFPPSYADRARERESLRHHRHMEPAVNGNLNSAPKSNPQLPLPMPPEFHSPSALEARQKGEVRVERNRIVIPRGKKIITHTGISGSNGKYVQNEDASAANGEKHKSAAAQTDVTFCAHECAKHHRLPDTSFQAEPNKGKRKESKGKEEGKEQNENTRKGENKAKHKDGRGKPAKDDSGCSEVDSGSDATESEDEKLIKRKSWRAGSENKKQAPKHPRSGDAELWDPAALPCLTSLIPGTAKLSKQEKQAIEHHQRESRESLAAARRADEEEARRWISQQVASTYSGALRWLRERDIRRQSTASNSAFLDPSELVDALKLVDGHKKGNRVSFQPLVHPFTPNPNIPLWADREDEVNLKGHGIRAVGAASSVPLVVYQDNGQIFASDGRPVQVVQNPRSQPMIPLAQTTAPSHTMPGGTINGPSQHFQPTQVAEGLRQPPMQGNGTMPSCWNQDRNNRGWETYRDPGRNGRDINDSGQNGNGAWSNPGPPINPGDSAWDNQNNDQSPNRPGSQMVVDEATGVSFHPAEAPPQEEFKSW